MGLAPAAARLLRDREQFGAGAVLGPLSDFIGANAATALLVERFLGPSVHAVVVRDRAAADAVRHWHAQANPGPLACSSPLVDAKVSSQAAGVDGRTQLIRALRPDRRARARMGERAPRPGPCRKTPEIRLSTARGAGVWLPGTQAGAGTAGRRRAEPSPSCARRRRRWTKRVRRSRLRCNRCTRASNGPKPMRVRRRTARRAHIGLRRRWRRRARSTSGRTCAPRASSPTRSRWPSGSPAAATNSARASRKGWPHRSARPPPSPRPSSARALPVTAWPKPIAARMPRARRARATAQVTHAQAPRPGAKSRWSGGNRLEREQASAQLRLQTLQTLPLAARLSEDDAAL